MSETVTCAKCMYTAKFPYTTGEMVKIFFDNHDCDSTKLQQAIERVRELAKKLREKPAFVNYTAWACSEEIIKALDGEA